MIPWPIGLVGCEAPVSPADLYESDPAEARARIEGIEDLAERTIEIETITRRHPGETMDLCPFAGDVLAREHCESVNQRPHLRAAPGRPAHSAAPRSAPGPGSGAMPAVPALLAPRTGPAPSCGDTSCLEREARARAGERDWAGVVGACGAIAESKWRDECFFEVAETSLRAQGYAAYADGAALCDQAGRFVEPCHGHLVATLASVALRAGTVSEAADALAARWEPSAAFRAWAVDSYWANVAMDRGLAPLASVPEPERPHQRFEMAYALGPGAGGSRLAEVERDPSGLVPSRDHRGRDFWPGDAPGEDGLRAAVVRVRSRRLVSSDDEVDRRICLAEAAALREDAIPGAGDPDGGVRWTVARLLYETNPRDPALAALAADPDPLVAARARGAVPAEAKGPPRVLP